MSKVSEIATYMRQNPSIMVGLDGYADPSGTDAYYLSDQRLQRDGRVEVLVRSGS